MNPSLPQDTNNQNKARSLINSPDRIKEITNAKQKFRRWKVENQYQPKEIREGFREICKNYESGTFILFNFPIHHPMFSSQTKSLVFPVVFFFLAFIP